jgi:hypothetical protein
VAAVYTNFSLCPLASLTATYSHVVDGLVSPTVTVPFSRIQYNMQGSATGTCLAATSILYTPAASCNATAPPNIARLRCGAAGQQSTIVQVVDQAPPYGALISLQSAKGRGLFVSHCSGVLYAVYTNTHFPMYLIYLP